MIVTHEIKDKVLKYLIANSSKMSCSYDKDEWGKALGIEPEIILRILKSFKDRNFISYTTNKSGTGLIDVEASAHEFVLLGGFENEFNNLLVQAEILERKLQEIKNQIDKKDWDIMFNCVSAISGLVSNIQQL